VHTVDTVETASRTDRQMTRKHDASGTA